VHGHSLCDSEVLSDACRGPTGTILNELAQACRETSDCQIVFVRLLSKLRSNIFTALAIIRMLPVRTQSKRVLPACLQHFNILNVSQKFAV